MWWNEYVGIPFLDKGRDRKGIDCWGLARLIYSEQFDTELPSFAEEYQPEDTARIGELIAQYREGWTETSEPKPGSIVLFRILGTATHVGVYLGQDKFIHARDGHSVAIENLQAPNWRSRIVGFFNYTEKSFAVLNAKPHPLRTQHWTLPVAPGTTIQQLSELVVEQCKVSKELLSSIVIILNGRVVEKSKYSDTVIYENDVLEYRAVPGKNALRIALVIAVIVVAINFGPDFAAYLTKATGITVSATAGTVIISTVGQLLIGALMPIRLPGAPGDPGSAQAQSLFSGGTNQLTKYSSIPVVLGKVRMTPPLGAQSYIRSDTDSSYLNMLLTWGFGPLKVTDFNIGANSFDQYENGKGLPIEYVTLNDSTTADTAEELRSFNSIYGSDIKQVYSGIELAANNTIGEVLGVGVPGPWTEVTLGQDEITKLDVTFHFPQGLRTLIIKGGNAGKTQAKTCKLDVEYRKVDSFNNPLTSWDDTSILRIVQKQAKLPAASLTDYTYEWTGATASSSTTNYYRWYRLAVTPSGVLVVKKGALTESPSAEPSAGLIAKQKSTTYGYDAATEYVRLPTLTYNEIPVVDICLYGSTVHTTSTAARTTAQNYYSFSIPYTYSGLALTTAAETVTENSAVWPYLSGTYATGNIIATIAEGSVARNALVATSTITLGQTNYVDRKDAFSHTHTISVPAGRYQVRVRRVDDDNTEPDNTYRHMHTAVLQTVTGTSNLTPTINPPGCVLTQTAVSIKATDQLNGNLEGVNALVETICRDWSASTSSWIMRTTSNPASLFLYVLTHPANPRRVLNSEIATKINLTAIQDWHVFCNQMGFTFNSIVMQQRSVLDILKDISAAGRASPAMVDGKWTVIIDRARTDIVQHFTPHNSWDFGATKSLPKLPDGFKILFNNEEKGYQEEELIVYNAGKNAGNSELFEQLYLPGTTNSKQASIHARWHFAQAKLRPEVFTLNTDLEYLVCNRGDRVKIVHDVPEWGLGSGRIKNRISSTVFELDEDVPLIAGTTYTIRVRNKLGGSVTRTVASVGVDGYYSQITVTASATAAQIDENDLFLFGTLNDESHDLLVLGIEPFGNQNAKITLVDYAADIYSIDYLSSTFTVPNYDSNITKPPANLVQSIKEKPTVTSFISDERVMEQIAPGVFKYNIKISFSNLAGLPSNIGFCEAQIDDASDTVENWQSSIPVAIASRSITIGGVQEAKTYRIRLRYIGKDGRLGAWTDTVNHTVVGKSNPPSNVAGFTATADYDTGKVQLAWNENLEIDIKGYEVRTENANWGTTTNLAARVFKGNADVCLSTAPALGVTKTFYIKAYDYGNNYSTTATAATFTTLAPTAPNTAATYTYADTSTTSSTITFNWTAAPLSQFQVPKYELTLTRPDGGATTIQEITGLTWRTNANWIGTATLSIKSINILGHKSATGYSTNVIKARPAAPTGILTTLNDSQLFIDWPDVVKATNGLPVGGYELRTTNSGWGTTGYTWKGLASNTVVKNITTSLNTWYLNTYDTDNNYALLGTVVDFTPQKPGAVTSVTSAFSTTSTTASTVTFKWTAPAITSYPIKHYLIALTKPAGYTALNVTATVDATTFTTAADWVGTAVLTIYTVDLIGNQSVVSSTNIIKAVPVAPASTSLTINDSQLFVDWADVGTVINGLPVAGYEIRKVNSGWGTSGTNLVWKGSASNTILKGIVAGANTWYINSYDTDNKYAVTGTTITFTATAPGAVTNVVAGLNAAATSTSNSTVNINWTAPTVTTATAATSPASGQFPVKHYLVTLTKPGALVPEPSYAALSNTATIDSTNWSAPADWVGTAVLTIYTVDIIGNQSVVSSTNVVKARPNAPSSVTFAVNDAQLLVDWADVATATNGLPVAGYEIRRTNTSWGVYNTDLIAAGSVSNSIIKNTYITGGAVNTYYINSYDTDNKYALNGNTITFTAQAPGIARNLACTVSSTSSSASATLTWDAPVVTSFKIAKYVVRITKPDNVTYTEVVLDSTSWTVPVDWIGTATFTIITKDLLDTPSATAATIDKLVSAPPTPAVVSFATSGKAINLSWAPTVPLVTGLPIAGYELRDANANWGTVDANLIWRGSASSFALLEFLLGTENHYLSAFDVVGNYSTTSRVAPVVAAAPGSLGTITNVFAAGTTGSTATLSWAKPAINSATQFALDYYLITVTKPSPTGPIVTTAKSLTNEYTLAADWTGTTTITVVAYDVIGYTSPTATISLPKLPPNPVTSHTTTAQTLSLLIDWPDVVKTSLPVAGYELRTTTTGWGTGGHTWKGSVSRVELIPAQGYVQQTWYLKTFDTAGEYSTTFYTINQTTQAPTQPTIPTENYTDTTSTGATITFDWASTRGTFPIKEYFVKLTKGSTVEQITLSATSWTTTADWLGAATIEITAYDTLGNASTTRTKALTKTAPGTPGPVTTTINTSKTGINLSWTAAAAGSLPIDGYELRPTGATPGKIQKISGLSVDVSDLLLGTNTWDLYAYDTDQRYSAVARNISYVISRPSTPAIGTTTFSTSLTNATAILKWSEPTTSAFGIYKYLVTFTTITPAQTLTSTRSTTEWEIPANWVGNGTLSVVAYDNLEFSSLTAINAAVAKVVPNAAGAITTAVQGTNLALDWPDTATAANGLPVLGYEIRSADSSWGTPGYIWKGSASNYTVNLTNLARDNPGGTANNTTLTWYLKAFDTDNRYNATATAKSYTIAAPVNTVLQDPYFEDTNLTSAVIKLKWSDTNPIFGLKQYEVGGTLATTVTTGAGSAVATVTGTYGVKGLNLGDVLTNNANIPAGTSITAINHLTNQITLSASGGVLAGTSTATNIINYTYTNATAIDLPADWLGDKSFTVKTVDLLGNKATGVTKTATKALPSSPQNLRAQVIDNTVLLYWDLPVITSLPISHIRLKKGPSWVGGELIGDKSGTFTTITELAGGVYTYWAATVDTDNNESVPISLASTVSAPPDYVFNALYTSTFTGTFVNALKEANTGYVVIPANTTESFEQHFTTPGWSGPSAQVAAGYPVYIQPGLTSGYYEELFDYGTVLGSSQISVALSGTPIVGSPAVSITISTSPDNVTYTTYAGASSVFGTSFRYIKVRLTVSQTTAGSIYQVTGLNVRLDAKQKTDSGPVVCASADSGGTTVNFNAEFVDVTSITLAPQGTTALIPVYDFKDNYASATYTLNTNLCTVTQTAHGYKSGQNIKLGFLTGGGISDVYTVTVTGPNTYTATISTANTSGTVQTYPQSMTVYLYNTSGVRQSGTVSWTVRGY